MFSNIVFTLFVVIGEVQFHLERLSGQPLDLNILRNYITTGFIFNKDVIDPLVKTPVRSCLSLIFIGVVGFYAIRTGRLYIRWGSKSYKSIVYTATIFTLLVSLVCFGPGSGAHARYVVSPPEWNLVKGFFDKPIDYSREEEKELIRGLRDLIDPIGVATWIGDEYPLMRKSILRDIVHCDEQPDIILLVVESLRGKELQRILNGSSNPYKNIKALADNGVYFNRFYSNGYPTVNGIFSVYTSTIPHLYQTNITHAQNVSFDGIGQRLRDNNYHSVAVWGGNPGHVNELKWAVRWFDKLDFNVPGDYFRHIKNRADAEVYKNLMKHINDHDNNHSDQPLFALAFSGMTHTPFNLDGAYYSSELQKQEVVDLAGDKVPTSRDEKYELAMKVLDKQIGKLQDLLSQRKKKNNTVILLLGDHSIFTEREITPEVNGFPTDDYVWTGAIISGPTQILGKDIPRVVNSPVSQSDLLPTVVNIIQDTEPLTAFGFDLLNPSLQRSRNIITVGPKGLRVIKDSLNIFFSKESGDNYWVIKEPLLDINSKVGATLSDDIGQEKIDEYRSLLSYWSALVDENRVWKPTY